MKIRTRLYLLSTLSMAALLIVSALGFNDASRSGESLTELGEGQVPKIEAILSFRAQCNNLLRRLYEATSKDSLDYPQQLDEIAKVLQTKRQADENVQNWFETYDRFEKTPEAQAMWERIAAAWKDWYPVIGTGTTRAMENAMAQPSPEKMEILFRELDRAVASVQNQSAEITDTLDKLSDWTKRVVGEVIENDRASASRIAILQAIVSIVALVGVIVVSILTLRAVIKPLELARNVIAQVEHDNDLRLRVDYHATDEVGETVSALNAMMQRLQISFQDIQKKVVEVNRLVEQLSTAASEVAASSSSQSSSTAAMAASVEEMTASINTVSGSASEAQGIAQLAGETSNEGGLIIERTAEEMAAIADTVTSASSVIQALGSESQQISSVVQVIKEVADQTNLLALNAAIEAARAGEQGRGFAVVADEVRKLAERTAQSTGDISAMIGKIQHSSQEAVEEMNRVVARVESGKSLAQDAGARITSIKEESSRVSGAVTEISEALKEQSVASQDIARHVESIAQMTDENNAAAEETASSAQQLSQLASEVSQTLGQFKV